MGSVCPVEEKTTGPDRLTERTPDKLNNPATVSDFDFHEGVNQILADFGMSAADSGRHQLQMLHICRFRSRLPMRCRCRFRLLEPART
jgi:hypothetical protein